MGREPMGAAGRDESFSRGCQSLSGYVQRKGIVMPMDDWLHTRRLIKLASILNIAEAWFLIPQGFTSKDREKTRMNPVSLIGIKDNRKNYECQYGWKYESNPTQMCTHLCVLIH
jgi:hypothetical protein